MSTYYDQTKQHWDQVFGQTPTYDPTAPLPYAAIEDALDWLCEDAPSVLDFGCGHGKMTLRCLDHGASKVCGMDISQRAVASANMVISTHHMEDTASFICGDIDSLFDCPSESYDAVLLFNIVDNLLPQDALCVLRQIQRLLKSHGKLLVKLNPYLTPQNILENNMCQVGEHIYRETTGLYLWNLTDEQWNAALGKHFTIERYEVIALAPHPITQRFFYLTKSE